MKNYLVVAVLKLEYSFGASCRRKRFETESEVYDYIKTLDKNKYERIEVFKLERCFKSGFDF